MAPVLQLLTSYGQPPHCRSQEVRHCAQTFCCSNLTLRRFDKVPMCCVAAEEIYYDAEETLSDYGEYVECPC